MNTPAYKTMPVVIGKPDRLEDPTQFVANDFDDERIEEAVAEVAAACDELRRQSFQGYYILGKVVQKHYLKVLKEREELSRGMYGSRFFHLLAKKLKKPNVHGGLLRRCQRLVESYTAEEYSQFLEQGAVSPTHALMLADIGDKDARKDLQTAIISKKLTTNQLQDAIKEIFGVRRKPGAGRSLKIPKSLKAAFVHLTAQAEKFIKLNDEVWFGDAYDIIEEVDGLPADKLTDEFKAKVIEAAEQCESVATTAAANAKALRGTMPNIEDRMKRQAELAAQTEAAIEAERRLEAGDSEEEAAAG